MGAQQSAIEREEKEVARLEERIKKAGGEGEEATRARAELVEKLHAYTRQCRLKGDLERAALALNKLVGALEGDEAREFELARAMGDLANVSRQHLEEVKGGVDVKDRTARFARAEDLLVRAVEILQRVSSRPEVVNDRTRAREVKLALAKTNAYLAMLQNTYGHFEQSKKTHETSLELFASFPLECDPDRMIFENGAWRRETKQEQEEKGGEATPTANNNNNREVMPSFPTTIIATGATGGGDHSQRKSRGAHPATPTKRRNSATKSNNNNSPNSLVATGTMMMASTTVNEAGAPKYRLILIPPTKYKRPSTTLEKLLGGSPSSAREGGGGRGERAGSSQLITDVSEVLGEIDLSGKSEDFVVGLELTSKSGMLSGEPTIGGSTGKRRDPAVPSTLPHVAIARKAKNAKELSEYHAVFSPELDITGDEIGWSVSDPHAPKGKGVRVNGVRIKKASLRVGDLVQLGGAEGLKLGESSKSKSSGLSYYVCERRFEDLARGGDRASDAVEEENGDGSLSSSTRSHRHHNTNPSWGGGFADESEALKHFTLLVHAACENARTPSLAPSTIKDMFTACVLEGGSPFHLWDDWIYAELSRKRYVGGLVAR